MLRRSALVLLLVCLLPCLSFGASFEDEVIAALSETVQALETTQAELATVSAELSQARTEQADISNTLRIVQNEQIPRLNQRLNDYEQSLTDQIRDIEIKAYLISAVGILSALLIAFLT